MIIKMLNRTKVTRSSLILKKIYSLRKRLTLIKLPKARMRQLS